MISTTGRAKVVRTATGDDALVSWYLILDGRQPLSMPE